MKVLITDNAYNDINEFVSISKASNKTLNSYIVSLLTFTLDLYTFPEIGKYDFTIETKIKKYEIRKLIYKQHKILYYIDSDIHVVAIMHSKEDTNKYISKLKEFIDFEWNKKIR